MKKIGMALGLLSASVVSASAAEQMRPEWMYKEETTRADSEVALHKIRLYKEDMKKKVCESIVINGNTRAYEHWNTRSQDEAKVHAVPKIMSGVPTLADKDYGSKSDKVLTFDIMPGSDIYYDGNFEKQGRWLQQVGGVDRIIDENLNEQSTDGKESLEYWFRCGKTLVDHCRGLGEGGTVTQPPFWFCFSTQDGLDQDITNCRDRLADEGLLLAMVKTGEWQCYVTDETVEATKKELEELEAIKKVFDENSNCMQTLEKSSYTDGKSFYFSDEQRGTRTQVIVMKGNTIVTNNINSFSDMYRNSLPGGIFKSFWNDYYKPIYLKTYDIPEALGKYIDVEIVQKGSNCWPRDPEKTQRESRFIVIHNPTDPGDRKVLGLDPLLPKED